MTKHALDALSQELHRHPACGAGCSYHSGILFTCVVLSMANYTVCIGYTPRARLLNHWATKPEVCNQLVL